MAVDVVIAAWNAAATVDRAVASALAEPDVASVTVVDDGSADATAAAAGQADDGSGRLHLIVLPDNLGPAAARNRAWTVGGAAWVAVLDADDWIMPGRFAALLAHAATADLIADDLLMVEAEGATPRPMFLPRVVTPAPLDAAIFIAGNVTHGARTRRDLGYVKPLIRRSLIADGRVFREDLRLGEDYELYARLLIQGARGLLAPAAGYVYTIAPGSLSGTHGVEALRALRDVDRDLMRTPGATRSIRSLLARHERSVDRRLQWRMLIEAVRSCDGGAAARCFLRSPPVSWFLLVRLAEQAAIRAKRLAGGEG